MSEIRFGIQRFLDGNPFGNLDYYDSAEEAKKAVEQKEQMSGFWEWKVVKETREVVADE